MNPSDDRLVRIEERLARLEALAGVILNHIGLPAQQAQQHVEAALHRQATGTATSTERD